MSSTTSQILHPKLSYSIIGAAMSVHRELGPGWDEETYHCALLHALNRQDIKAESKLRGTLKNHGLVADEFELDILVEDIIVLELKHIRKPFAPAHYCQLINYLKFWKKDLGILINFGLERLEYKRVPFSPENGQITNNYLWEKLLSENNPGIRQIHSALLAIFENHGLGYAIKTYEGLFATECQIQGIQHSNPVVNLQFKGTSVGDKGVDAFLIEKLAIVSVTALNENSSAIDLTRLLSYMRHTNINIGILANFGKKALNIRLLTL
jgi:GxxExxY protein